MECVKHPPEHWWRLSADSVLTPEGKAGIWTCSLCYPMPEKLAPETEQFDPAVHETQRMAERKKGMAGVPVAIQEIERALARWREQDDGWAKARVVTLARIHSEFHSSMFEDEVAMKALRSLVGSGLMEKGNRHGVEERRGQSNVWRLTRKGRVVSLHLRRMLGDTDRLPGPRPKEHREAV